MVSSSRYPDQWIVPGGGMEPEEEPGGAAVREVYEEVTKTKQSKKIQLIFAAVVFRWEPRRKRNCLLYPVFD